jgi:hypothetical protein
VNDQDDVAFTSQVSDAAGNFAEGVFVRTAAGSAGSKVNTIARPGDKAPDGSTFVRVRRPNLNNAGVVVFEGTTDKDDSVRIYQYKDSKITTLVEPNTNIAGIGMLAEVKRPRLNNQGEMIFLGRPDTSWGLYHMTADGKLSAILTPGADLKDGNKLDEVIDKDGSAALADSGDIVMILKRAADSTLGVYVMHAGQLVDVAPIGTNVPGAGTIDVLSQPSGQYEHVALNSVGQVAFPATFKDGHTGLVLATPVP